MEYKAVWPTSGRDFVNLVALREVQEGLYVVAAAGVSLLIYPAKSFPNLTHSHNGTE